MNIGHFPTPHPEELFYSVCARFQDRMDYRDKRFIGLELFGQWHTGTVADLPGHLAYFTRALPRGHLMTVDRIIEEYTLFPFFRPFLSPDRVRRVKDSMATGDILAARNASGSVGTRILTPDWLRYCPACVEEDIRNFKEPYWHRLPQVPGVEVCPTHRVFIEDGTARMRLRRNNFDYVSAERGTRVVPARPLDPSDKVHNILLRVARDAEWLLGQRGLCPGLPELRRRYTHALFERGFCTYSGFLNRARFEEHLRSYYGRDLLRLLQCEISEEALSSWPSVFMKDLGKGKLQHPLRHLLVIQSIGYTAESFFKMNAEYAPFGAGPWPCLNSACENYRRLVIDKYELTFSGYGQRCKAVGVFGCECGFVYSRLGSGATGDDRFRWHRVIAHGPKWDAAFRDLWDDSTLLLEEISLRLYGKRKRDYKVKIQAERLGLRFPRQVKNYRPAQVFRVKRKRKAAPPAATVNESSEGNPLKKYRADWLEVLRNNPDSPRTLLRDKYSPIFKWLFRHDREWLKVHQPPPRDHTYDWPGIDSTLAKEVKEAARHLSDHLPPTRITVWALGRYTGKYEYLRRAQDKLPLTAAVIRDVLETREAFYLRKANRQTDPNEEIEQHLQSLNHRTIA